jgi:hypothetical protein
MAYEEPQTVSAGETTSASKFNKCVNAIKEIWKGAAAGDIDYYSGATSKAKLAAGEPFDLLCMDAAGTALRWKQPTCSLYGNYYANSGALRIIEWYGAIKDTDSFWSAAAPTKITIPAGFSGIYLITSVLIHTDVGSSLLRIYNSSNTQKMQFAMVKNGDYVNFSGIIALYAGMWFEQTITVTSSGAVTKEFLTLTRLCDTDVSEASVWP